MTYKSRIKCCVSLNIATFLCVFYGDVVTLQYGCRVYFRAQGIGRPSSSRPNFLVLVLARPIILQETIETKLSMARTDDSSNAS